jgi:hypothetical protein
MNEYDTSGWDEGDVSIYQSIVEAEELAVNSAMMVIDKYWVNLDSSNRTILNNRKSGQDPGRQVACLAPVLEVAPSTGRNINRLIWRIFLAKGYQRINRSAGKRVPYSRGTYEYTYNPNTLLSHSVGWDARAILEAEAKLEPMRLALKNYQRILVSIAARYRRINKLNEKRENTYGE